LKAEWLGATVEYEGFPLALRVRPQADSPANQTKLPHLVALTHHLDHVRADGLPKAGYNDTLDSFDGDVVECLERYGLGLVVVVETFAGRRTYYACGKAVDLAANAIVSSKPSTPITA
jgi:hypothetical protein